MRIRCSAQSDVGRGRSQNEDSFAVDGDRGIFVVADGMGGHGNGEVASRIVADVVRRSLAPKTGRGSDDGGRSLRHALEEANRRVIEAARGDKALTGMGATAVVATLGRLSQIAGAQPELASRERDRSQNQKEEQ